MTDEPNTPSGSRWEPETGDATETPAAAQAAAQADTAPDPGVRARLRGRAVLAGAATALALGGGLAGFVVGHATAGDGSDDFRPVNFSQPGPGGQPGDGQQQGPPSFRSGDGDHDGDGFGPPRGLDGGTSSNDSGATGSST